MRHKTWLRECFRRPQCVNAAGCGGNRFFLFSISHSPVGKRSFTTYQPPPEHVGKDGLSREQTFPISGCREDFFWIGAQSLLFRVKKKKKRRRKEWPQLYFYVLTTGECCPASRCSSVMSCLLFLGADCINMALSKDPRDT